MKSEFAITSIMGVIILAAVILVAGFVCETVNNTVTTAQKEFYPDALLKKYEYFKDAAAQLDKKQADIAIYTSKIKSMKDDYAGQKRSSWDRTDKETFNTWEQELAGIKASYNGLAAEYNAQMVKFNWKFCNLGSLPNGATIPLPREYKPYDTN